MLSKEYTVKNPSGLHLRPATIFSQACAKLDSEIRILFKDKVINPKSVLMLMGAGITKDSEIVIEVDGPNEEADLASIIETLESGLGE
ncbi:MAG: HPr family phosphocarrier protein [Eubacteriales bacterium]|nr:HPr family phosphocarrier protein [Eubacteriales bacterium]